MHLSMCKDSIVLNIFSLSQKLCMQHDVNFNMMGNGYYYFLNYCKEAKWCRKCLLSILCFFKMLISIPVIYTLYIYISIVRFVS